MIYRKQSGALVSRGGVSADVQGSHSQCNAVQKISLVVQKIALAQQLTP